MPLGTDLPNLLTNRVIRSTEKTPILNERQDAFSQPPYIDHFKRIFELNR